MIISLETIWLIELIFNSQNRGPGYNRNLGWSLCDTEFIAFCDDDDIWFPRKLELQLLAMKYSGCKMAGGWVYQTH